MDKDTEKKIKENKKNTKAAEKKATKVKGQKIAKRAGDVALLQIAAELPAGGAKQLLVKTAALDKVEEQIKTLNESKRAIRTELKEMKIEMGVYDHVRKLRKMAPADAKSFVVTQALYTEKLGMPLTDGQKQMIDDLKKRQDEAAAAMSELAGGASGKEVGSSTVEAEEEAEESNDNTAAVPAKNDGIRNQFAGVSTH